MDGWMDGWLAMYTHTHTHTHTHKTHTCIPACTHTVIHWVSVAALESGPQTTGGLAPPTSITTVSGDVAKQTTPNMSPPNCEESACHTNSPNNNPADALTNTYPDLPA